MKKLLISLLVIAVLIVGYIVISNLLMTEEESIIREIDRTERKIKKAKTIDELEYEYDIVYDLYWESEHEEVEERMIDLYMVYSEKKEVLEEKENQEYKIVAYTAAQMAVRDILRSPSTAEFQSIDKAIYKNKGNNKHEIVLWVDAQNAFGATVRESYIVSLTGDEGGMSSTNVSKIK